MDFDPFDKDVPVPVDARAWDFEHLADAWRSGESEERRALARQIENSVHEADVRRAAKPPEISVTVPGLPGTITTVPGSDTVAWTVPVPVK